MTSKAAKHRPRKAHQRIQKSESTRKRIQGSQDEKLSTLELRWGKPLVEAGYTMIPDMLLAKQHALGLKPTDMCILLQILRHWWRPEKPPFPSKDTIAEAIGVDARTVQRGISNLKELKLLATERKSGPWGTNEYHFDGLKKELEPYAKERLRAKKKRAEEDRAQAARRRPRSTTLSEDTDD